ncbi:Endogenous retrovirus group K member 8 Pol protein [Lonchura striata]|uniref:ribonuclease H n=1 Tax=Lonchura striata TaxID=40157 RepID=A0A218UJA7_9PASE|nr:Endogenous retrovirus group K member 8 Pol protein [Lonchura striata domestica]
MDALLDNRFEGIGPLMMLWKRLDAIWQGSDTGGSRDSLRNFSISDVGEAESLGRGPDSPCAQESESEDSFSSGEPLAPSPLAPSVRSVTVCPRDHGRFWQEVLDKAEEMCDLGPSWSPPDHGEDSSGSADAAGGVVSSDVAPPRSPGAAAVPESTGHDTVDDAALPGGLQAFPVLRGVTHNTHQPFSFKVLKEIRDTVAQHGLGSDEVMHMIRLLVTDLLTPSDIRSVAQALFNPVQFDVFEDKWVSLVASAVRKNATRGQQDPRRVVNADMLMGTGNYVDPRGQAGYDPLVLDQCRTLGLAAMIQALEMAAPMEPFLTVVQRADEPFIDFASRLTASVERQVVEPELRRMLLARFARIHCNADCKRVIQALPEGATISQMAAACADIGPSVWKVHKVPLDAFGPLGEGMSAFLMGRSSATLQGIIVHLGLIDADFTGQICAMISTPTPPVTIPKGTRLAQLVPFKSSVRRTADRSRGDGSFGSTGPPQVHWTAVLTKDCPEMLCTLSIPGATPSEIRLRGLLDSGADVTVLSLAAWPPDWPLDPVEMSVAGLGGTVRCYEQLDQGRLEPSRSPWNTPVFCIKKKSGKWRLLQDLRKVSAVMEGMGTLQAGMPSSTMLPAGWPIFIVDLKDCFFTIPLHPDDRPKFAFTVLAVDNDEPAQRYQWEVLPQGMRNSLVICQWYVARALSGVHKQFPDARLYHYMCDILVAASTQEELLRIQPRLLDALHAHGLQVAPENVQQQPPWKYLGVKILERTIQHQEVQFVHSVKTLNDVQKLMGVITWLRPYLGLTDAQLSPVYDLLKGDPDLKSPRTLTPEARQVLEEVQQAVSARQVYHIDLSVDVTVFVTTPDSHPTGIIGQWSDKWSDPLHILEWVFLPHQPQKTAMTLVELIARLIIKCRQRCLQLMGADPAKIVLPISREDFDWSFAHCVSMQCALENFSGQITYHFPSHKLLQVAKSTQISLRPRNSQEPVQGPTVFTDGSGKTGKAIVTWKDGSEWQVLKAHQEGSAQLVELRAGVMAFERFSQEPFNLVTDSAYVADIA